MKNLQTDFTDHEAATAWAEKQGYTVIMTSIKDGLVSLMVTGGNDGK
jgi:hypothetical protein